MLTVVYPEFEPRLGQTKVSSRNKVPINRIGLVQSGNNHFIEQQSHSHSFHS